MTKQDFIALGIDEDIALKCEKLSLAELSSFVPSSILDETQAGFDNQIRQLKLEFAVESALSSAGAINHKTVVPLLAFDDLSFADDGSVCGLEEQISALASANDTAFLFSSSSNQFVGVSVGESGDDFAEKPFSYSSVARMFEQNPNFALN